MEIILADKIGEAQGLRILEVVGEGGVIAFPTDTSYALGVDPRNERALKKLFEIKGRDEDKAILLLIDSLSMATTYSEATRYFAEVASFFWPGPLTLVLPASPKVSNLVTADRSTVGLRWPDHPLITKLIARLGHPLTGTSANLSGKEPARSASDVVAGFGETVDLVIDGGSSPLKSQSTLLDLTGNTPNILREGSISYEVLAQFFNGRIERLGV